MAISKKFLRYAFTTGLLAGSLDLGGAVVNYIIAHGKFPYKILEYIASGAFGKLAMDGSIGSDLWGFFFHYFIAISFTMFYFFIYPRTKFLQKNIVLSAMVYGLFVWAVTNMIVLPLSGINGPVIPPDFVAAAKADFILIICIGLTVAYFTNRFYSKLILCD